MMGKRSKRSARVDRDIHAAIRSAAAQLAAVPMPGMSSDLSAYPDLEELLEAASMAVEAAVPTSFAFHGRRYFLRARVATQIEIFDGPGSVAPLVCGAVLSFADVGHVPGH